MFSGKEKMKLFIRRKICSSIKTLDEATPHMLEYFFLSDYEWQHGDVVADESGNLWKYCIEEYGIFLVAENANDQGMIQLLLLK
tara:strand:+ start:2865 stop:3116 length:252 start_codon:yes stop_codon:yes gene_type:complete